VSFALKHISSANTQNPIASIITTCPTHSQESKAEGEGLGGSGVMLN